MARKNSGAVGKVTATRQVSIRYNEKDIRKIITDYTIQNHGVVISADSWTIECDPELNSSVNITGGSIRAEED